MKKQILTVLPMSQTIDLKPGKTYEGSIMVAAPADAEEDISYEISINPYSVSGEEYDVNLRDQHNASMITKWITVPEPTGTVKPNETKEVKFIVKVPKDAPGGGQYATLSVTNKTSDSDAANTTTVQNVVELASILYASVDGEIIHGGEILANDIPGFSAMPPVKLTSTIRNTGNVHDYADYTITITDVFTGRVILPNNDSDGIFSEVIMPDSTYNSSRELSDLPMVGLVKVTQSIRFNDEISIAENTIFICPIWFMVLVGLTLISLIAVITTTIKHHKKKKVVY